MAFDTLKHQLTKSLQFAVWIINWNSIVNEKWFSMNHASFVEKYRSKSVQQYRGVTRLDGARGKKQVWYLHGRTWEIFRKQMYCIEGSTCDIVGNFRHPPQSFGAPIVIQRPANCSLLAPLRYAPATVLLPNYAQLKKQIRVSLFLLNW